MAKTYSKAPDEVTDRCAHIIKLFYPDLFAAEIRIDLLSISDEDAVGPCLKHQGYGAAAVVRILDVKARTMGRGDAEIVIDEWTYLKMTEAEKDALLDHEIHHIELRTIGKTRIPIRDERNRPKMRLKRHDRQFGWFDAIAERHGQASGEVKQVTRLYLEAKQIYFTFAEMPLLSETALDRAAAKLEKAIGGGMSVTITAGGISGSGRDMAETKENEEELLPKAIALVTERQTASVALIQRGLKIGYNRASRLMTLMEERKIVGPEVGAAPREVLVKKAPTP